jgi:hypothetical protein
VAEARCGFGTFFSVIPRRLDNLWYGGLCHFHGIYNTKA